MWGFLGLLNSSSKPQTRSSKSSSRSSRTHPLFKQDGREPEEPQAAEPEIRSRNALEQCHPVRKLPRSKWRIGSDESSSDDDFVSGESADSSSGSHGTAYCATNGASKVAVKIYMGFHSPTEQAIILNHMAFLEVCWHRNIVQLYGASVAGDRVVVITESMEAGNLATALRHNPKEFSWYRRGKQVAVEIARGLHFLHSRKIVHSDLRSCNVLLKENGIAKISDVGFVQMRVNTSSQQQWWTAPEAAYNTVCTVEADIYSFGTILWELITGGALGKGSLGDCSVPEECPADIEQLIHRCLSDDPARRPSSTEVLDVVTRVRNGNGPVPSTPLRFLNQVHSSGRKAPKAKKSKGRRNALTPNMSWRDWELSPKDVSIVKDDAGSSVKLATDAYGTAYKATMYKVCAVAVKEFPKGLSNEHETKILKGITFLAGGRHRNIIQFHGLLIVKSRMRLVTELMNERSLRRALKRQDLTERSWETRGKQIATDIAHGLRFLHSHDIIHFNLRSSNVLLPDDGPAKLTNIGFAKSSSYKEERSAWVAPEVLAGSACTEKVDIYSFGVILWEMVLGEQPNRRQLRECKIPKDCPTDAKELILRCLAFEADDRPKCEEILAILTNGKAGGLPLSCFVQQHSFEDRLPELPSMDMECNRSTLCTNSRASSILPSAMSQEISPRLLANRRSISLATGQEVPISRYALRFQP